MGGGRHSIMISCPPPESSPSPALGDYVFTLPPPTCSEPLFLCRRETAGFIVLPQPKYETNTANKSIIGISCGFSPLCFDADCAVLSIFLTRSILMRPFRTSVYSGISSSIQAPVLS